ncbi:MAG: FAD-dependent oxidoreductase, partial [Actinomycetota bacterium]|nr:FAD-dependent oxidoreductase [Actinomycetota bacterium]
MSVRFVIVGGGPAGNQAATNAARLGANVTLVERDVVGGAAHLWDCIPSKAMIGTGGAMSFVDRASGMGLTSVDALLDVDALKHRIVAIEERLRTSVEHLLADQGVRVVRGRGRLAGPHAVVVETTEGTEELEADAVLVATGSRPRIPDWCAPDGERILTTRQAYPPPAMPDHLVVIGSGVTGVEFVHMFASFGAKVTLVVSRQQVLPNKDPEVAATLEEEFLRRGVRLLIGARAVAIDRDGEAVTVRCDDGRVVRGSHALLAIGSVPNTDGLGLQEAG